MLFSKFNIIYDTLISAFAHKSLDFATHRLFTIKHQKMVKRIMNIQNKLNHQEIECFQSSR
jgi:hypothetical protein